MHKLFRVAIILAVVALSLAIAAPALANGPVGYLVQPTLGGANENETHFPPGAPIVVIPATNPAIVDDPSNPVPGDVFWPQ